MEKINVETVAKVKSDLLQFIYFMNESDLKSFICLFPRVK